MIPIIPVIIGAAVAASAATAAVKASKGKKGNGGSPGIAEAIGAVMGKLKAVIVALLKFLDIRNWLRKREPLMKKDADILAFSIAELRASGEYEVVHGIFNERKGTIVEDHNTIQAEKYQAREIDDELAGYHRGKKLVIYQH